MNHKFSNWYQTHMERLIPAYAFFSFIACFGLNCLIYFVTQILASGRFHYNLTSSLDEAVPFVPQWVLIYVLSFAFWVVNYAMTAKFNSKDFWFRFVFADMIARVICGIIFVIFPTTNLRPEIIGHDFFDYAMRFIYYMDMPYNLFPSIHCLASLMCFLGIRSSEGVPRWYKVFSLIFAILIFASTQFTKQHYLVDVAGGVLLALFCFGFSMKTKYYKWVMTFFDWLNGKVFGGDFG